MTSSELCEARCPYMKEKQCDGNAIKRRSTCVDFISECLTTRREKVSSVVACALLLRFYRIGQIYACKFSKRYVVRRLSDGFLSMPAKRKDRLFALYRAQVVGSQGWWYSLSSFVSQKFFTSDRFASYQTFASWLVCLTTYELSRTGLSARLVHTSVRAACGHGPGFA